MTEIPFMIGILAIAILLASISFRLESIAVAIEAQAAACGLEAHQ